MYRQPENSNRVKSMKSKFEDLNDSKKTQKSNDKFTKINNVQNKLTSKPPIASLNVKIGEKLPQKTENNNNTKKSKENNEYIKIDRKNKTTKTEDMFRNKFEKNSNGTKDFSDINKKELCNVPPLNLTRQLNDPSKKGCIKRTPAFRKDKIGKTKVLNDDLSFANIVNMFENNDNIKPTCDTLNDNTTKILTRTYCSDSEIKSDKTKMIGNPKKNVTSTVSLNGLSQSIVNKENDKNVVSKSILTASTSLGLENNNKNTMRQKSLSPILKKATEYNSEISSTSTLKISDKENNTKSQPNELLDNIVNKQHEKETTKVLVNAAYAQVNKPKKTTQLPENKNVILTDTLKAALKQPLPPGPPPKKPPRTFAHTPNSKSPSTSTKLDHNPAEITSTSSTPDTSINEKLNECLANALKTKTNSSSNNKPITKIKSDPKLMLQKLENALLNNKIKSPKLPRKLKSTFDGVSSSKASTSSTTQPNIYTSETPQKNLFPNCLPSLNCVTNAASSNSYTKVNSSMSTFFTDIKEENEKQEPIYAEPFHFKTPDESPKLSSRDSSKFDTLSSSLHYMVSKFTSVNIFVH